MVVAEAGRTPLPCLLGDERLILPSSSRAVGNPSVESPVMVRYGYGGPPLVENMMTASKPSPMGERLRPPKGSTMNLRLLKRMISPREKPRHHKRSPPVATVSSDDGTIRTSRGKACCKFPFPACQLSVFFALAIYRVVKITRSYFETVLRTTKHIIIYPSLDPSCKVIAIHPAV
jgi:hypothetical protein